MLSTDFLIIGGGATGLGVAWDAALRGFKTLLVEKGDVAHGTSGRYHGLLHSGGRYVARDPRSAHECMQENARLKKLLPTAIEDTGGYFAALPEDPADYVEPFTTGCQKAGIPAEEITPAQALKEEPLLNPRFTRIFRVPDASCDSFDAAHSLVNAIQSAGGEVWLRHKVVGLAVEQGRVVGAELENVRTGERVSVRAEIVISATGAWAGQVAALAGCHVNVTPGKGVMVAMNVRMVNTVINRLKPPSDGDILVPVGTVAVMGTTDQAVTNPDQYAIEDWEVELMLAEGEKMVPRFREFRALRAWAGVRPLFQDTQKAGAEGTESRLMTRAHAILDHAARDGVEGLISIVGGKFTTFRLMAEEAVDLACRQLKTERPCKTAETPIDPPGSKLHTLGHRLHDVEHRAGKPEIICECELVTRPQIEAALQHSGSNILNDLRRDLRVGMGPCQAGFCAFRAVGILAESERQKAEGSQSPASSLQSPESINSALIEFLQERWKGLRPVMWGDNLQQMELDLNIYRHILGIDRLPLAREPEVYPTEKTA
jgi:glycerol-3-phosphate dehydrogenase